MKTPSKPPKPPQAPRLPGGRPRPASGQSRGSGGASGGPGNTRIVAQTAAGALLFPAAGMAFEATKSTSAYKNAGQFAELQRRAAKARLAPAHVLMKRRITDLRVDLAQPVAKGRFDLEPLARDLGHGYAPAGGPARTGSP